MIDVFEKLQKDAVFEKVKDLPLVHVFLMLPGDFNPDVAEVPSLQFGFFEEAKRTITSIEYANNAFTIAHVDEPLGNNDIPTITLDGVISLSEVYAILKNTIKENYKGNVPMKTIMVLQKLQSDFVWNVTIIRSDFKTLNVRIDAISGEVLEHSLKALIEMDK